MTSGDRDIGYQRSVIRNRSPHHMTGLVECDGSPPLLPSTRSPALSGLAHAATCHPERAFCAKDLISAPAPLRGSQFFSQFFTRARSARTSICHPERSEGSAFSAPPDPCSLISGIPSPHRHGPSQHNGIFPHHSLHARCTICRVTTYPPVQPSRCYSYPFRLAQHGITQCRGGHA
jgi:hypothetical protein